MRVNLVAVQAKMALADYRDAGAFRSKISALMSRAMTGVDADLPTLVAFPEAIGMYLAFVPYYWESVAAARTMSEAVENVMAAPCARPDERPAGTPAYLKKWVLFIEHAVETERVYVETFSTLAREYGAYISAGSVYLPPLEDSPHRGGRFVQDATKVYNTSYLFSPRGVCLSRSHKVNIPDGEDELTDGAPIAQPGSAETAIGRIGTLICWDGFHHTLFEQCDALGVQILVQPQYYNGAGPLDKLDPWSFIALLQGRENIRYGVSSFLVGSVFEDTRAEGLSYVAANTGRAGAGRDEAIIAIAAHADAECVVSATVDLRR